MPTNQKMSPSSNTDYHEEDDSKKNIDDDVMELLDDCAKHQQQLEYGTESNNDHVDVKKRVEDDDRRNVDESVIGPAIQDIESPDIPSKTSLCRQSYHHLDGVSPGAFPINPPGANCNDDTSVTFTNCDCNESDEEDQHVRRNNNNEPPLEVEATLVTAADGVRNDGAANMVAPVNAIPQATNVTKVATDPIQSHNNELQRLSKRNFTLLTILIIVIIASIAFSGGIYFLNHPSKASNPPLDDDNDNDDTNTTIHGKPTEFFGGGDKTGGDREERPNDCADINHEQQKQQKGGRGGCKSGKTSSFPHVSEFERITQNVVFFNAHTDCNKLYSTSRDGISTNTLTLIVTCGNSNRLDGKEAIQYENSTYGIVCNRTGPYTMQCDAEMDGDANTTNIVGAVFFSCGNVYVNETTTPFPVASASITPLYGEGCTSASSNETVVALSMSRYCGGNGAETSTITTVSDSIGQWTWESTVSCPLNAETHRNNRTFCESKIDCLESNNMCTVDNNQVIDFMNDIRCDNPGGSNGQRYAAIDQVAITHALNDLALVIHEP